MALLSELVATCEAHRLDTQATLTVFARRLREAGRLSQAGRGRGAAHMTFLDAARFLIACAATDHPERAVDAEHEFSRFENADGVFADEAARLTEKYLDEALAKVMEWLCDGTLVRARTAKWAKDHPAFSEQCPVPVIADLTVSRGGTAWFNINGAQTAFHHPALIATVGSIKDGGYPVQKVAQEAFERETYRFRTGKNLTARLDTDLIRAVADLIAGKAASE